MQFIAEWAGAWHDWEMEAEDYIDAGERGLQFGRDRDLRAQGLALQAMPEEGLEPPTRGL